MTEILDEGAVSEIEAQSERCLSFLTFGEPTRGNRYVESIDADFYFEENTDAEFDAFDLLRHVPALCTTVKHLRAERLEIQRVLASSVLDDPTEDDEPPYSTTELVEGVRFILSMKAAKVVRTKELQSQLEQLRERLTQVERERNLANSVAERLATGCIAVDDFRSRAIQLCKDKEAKWRQEAGRAGMLYARVCREKATLLRELVTELEKL